jgi:hypothetical protein
MSMPTMIKITVLSIKHHLGYACFCNKTTNISPLLLILFHLNSTESPGFEVLMVVAVKSVIFWDILLCGLAEVIVSQ